MFRRLACNFLQRPPPSSFCCASNGAFKMGRDRITSLMTNTTFPLTSNHSFASYFRTFSTSAHQNIYKSPFPSPGAPSLSAFTDFLMEDALERHKDVALVHPDSGETLTYGQLREKVQDLAIQFYIRGWEQGQTIAIILTNKAVFPLTVFAAAKVGIKTTIINPQWKSRMWVKQLRQCKADYIITTVELLHHVRDACQSLRTIKEILILNREDDERDKKEYRLSIEMKYNLLLGKPPGWGALPEWTVKGDEVMIVPYTAQGERGVELTHEQMSKSLLQIQSIESSIEPQHVFATALPFNDIFTMMYTGSFPYLRGAKTVLLEKLDPRRFFEVVQDQKVNTAHVSAEIFKELVNGEIYKEFDLSSLSVLVYTQHADIADIDKIEAKLPSLRVKQGYSIQDLTPPVMLSPTSKIKKGSVGVLLPDTEAKVIDTSTKAEVGPNKEGELWVKGDQVMPAWFHSADLTAKDIDGDGFFRTGDRAKVDEDGYWWITKK